MAIISQEARPKSGNIKKRSRASKWHKLEFCIYISYWVMPIWKMATFYEASIRIIYSVTNLILIVNVYI